MNQNIAKTELFAAFQSLSEAVPEMRVGQLVAAVGELCADLHGRGLWDAADTELLEAVWQFHRNFEDGAGLPNSQEPERTDERERRLTSVANRRR